MKERVCTSCGFEGKPINQSFESFFVDAFIWGIVGSFALMTGLIPALVIPAAWTLYHIAKFGDTKCPQCKNLEMVSKTSRKGRAALGPEENKVTVWVNSEAVRDVE